MGGIIVLIAFFVAFAGIALWAYLPANKDKMTQHGNIPFIEDRYGR